MRVAVPEKNIDSYDICEEDKMNKNNLFIIQFIVMYSVNQLLQSDSYGSKNEY
jgi:hypothetical protein